MLHNHIPIPIHMDIQSGWVVESEEVFSTPTPLIDNLATLTPRFLKLQTLTPTTY